VKAQQILGGKTKLMTQFAEYSTFRVHIDNTCDNGLNNEILQPTDLIAIF